MQASEVQPKGHGFGPRAALSEMNAVPASQSPCLAGVFWSWLALPAPAAMAAAPAGPVPRCRTASESSWLPRPSGPSTDDAAPLSALATPPGSCTQEQSTMGACCSPALAFHPSTPFSNPAGRTKHNEVPGNISWEPLQLAGACCVQKRPANCNHWHPRPECGRLSGGTLT